MLVTAGSYGMGAEASGAVLRDDPRIAALLSGTARLAGPDELPAELGAEGHASWIVVPLRRSGIAVGLLAVASTEADNPDATRFVVEQLANETAVAVENAQLFARVGELSAQEERRRLARELHDGVAQGLAHVRFELGLLARGEWESEENVRSEVGRLSRVVGRALDEVRSTIVGLRPAVEGAGLSEALGAYLRDLRALGGPELTFRTLGTVDLPTTVSEEVFRIGQEAVSNALRHAHAQRVTVTLEGHDTLVVLTVTDDGIGIRSSGTTGGIGLRAMNERAQRIDGRLRVTEQPSGGTRVELLAPLPPTEIDAEGGRT
jgi:signal transduction histidine kinase